MSTSVICPIVFSLHGGTTCTVEPLTMKVSHSIQVLSSHTKLDRKGCSWSVLLKSVIVRNTHIIVLSGYGLLRKGNGYLYHLWCASECFSSLATVEPLNEGHIDTSHFVHCRVIVHSSEMKHVLAQ